MRFSQVWRLAPGFQGTTKWYSAGDTQVNDAESFSAQTPLRDAHSCPTCAKGQVGERVKLLQLRELHGAHGAPVVPPGVSDSKVDEAALDEGGQRWDRRQRCGRQTVGWGFQNHRVHVVGHGRVWHAVRCA